MKLETFINKLLSVGFVRNANDGASNWYENHINGASIFVGIMANEIDSLGHIPIEVIYFNDNDDEEVEKEYMTTAGAWKTINNLVN